MLTAESSVDTLALGALQRVQTSALLDAVMEYMLQGLKSVMTATLRMETGAALRAMWSQDLDATQYSVVHLSAQKCVVMGS